MEQRDKELDDLQNAMTQGTPFIHPPDEREQTNGMCWINSNRACGADCMAFDPEAPEGYEKCRVLGAAQVLIGHGSLLSQGTPRIVGRTAQDFVTNMKPPGV